MLVRDCMTTGVRLSRPDMLVSEAARLMKEGDFGILPVEKDDRLIGMITDRDIAIRCVASNSDLKTSKVAEVMTDKVFYCFEDQDIEEVARNLGEKQIRRIPVVNREKRLVGILSLADLALSECRAETIERVVSDISQSQMF